MVPYQETPVEHVEGEIDLSEDMFPKIPGNMNPMHSRLRAEDFKALRVACIHYARTAPIQDGTTGHLSQLMKRMLRLVKEK